MITHKEAKDIVDSLGYSPEESLAIRGVAWLESNYGNGWAGEGIGSNNWGAVTAGNWKGPTFNHPDSRYDESTGKVISYNTKFRRYVSSRDGAADLARIMLKPNVVSAINNKDLKGVSRAMRENSYYTGIVPYEESINIHHKRLKDSIATIIKSTGEPNPFLSQDGSGLSPMLLAELLEREPFTMGTKGDEVKKIQTYITMFGIDLNIDGFWGPLSSNAWKKIVTRQIIKLHLLFNHYD